MPDHTPEPLIAGSPRSLAEVVDCIKRTGGAVEISGVRIEPCDDRGDTATTRNVADLMDSLSQMEGKHLRALSLIHHLMRSRRAWQAQADLEADDASSFRGLAILRGVDKEIAQQWAAWFAAERDYVARHRNEELAANRAHMNKMAAQMDANDARIAELEAAQPETVGYVVAARRDDGEFFGATIWTDPEQARAAEGVAAGYALDGESYDLYRVVRDA